MVGGQQALEQHLAPVGPLEPRLSASRGGLGLGFGGREVEQLVHPGIVATRLFLASGGYLLLETWVDANAHEIAVPSWFNGEYDGGRFTGQFYRLPDGSEVSSVDIGALTPPGVDPDAWVAGLHVVAVGVHAPDYSGWVATEVAVFGVFGLVWLAATFAIVERRRPF